MDEFDHLLLHLSDIHFRIPNLGPAYDLDSDLRNRLIDDAGTMRSKLGSPSAILVSGDVAFSGKKDQYEEAERWLDDELCVSVQGDPASVWCVPGNHDVDRSVKENRPSYNDARNALRQCDPHRIDSLLAEHLNEPHKFYDAIGPYNDFALRHGCEISVGQPVWNTGDAYQLSDGSILRIFGLNSALISDERDHVEHGKLVVGRYQCQLLQNPRYVNVAMCHHPPDWLRDYEMMEETLNPRCSIQLFGHKHRYKLGKYNETLLRVSAGAVHPSRSETNWEPRYNWIGVRVQTESGKRRLAVRVYPRVWNADLQTFSPDLTKCSLGSDFVAYSLQLPEFTETAGAANPPRANAEEPSEPGPPALDDEGMRDGRGNPIVDAERALARRYLQLGYVKRMQVAIDLKLLQDNDDTLTDHEREVTHLSRAKERHLLGQLWEAVERAHADGRYPENPFN